LDLARATGDEPELSITVNKDASGKYNPMFSLDFVASMALMTGCDAPSRAAVIKRWKESWNLG